MFLHEVTNQNPAKQIVRAYTNEYEASPKLDSAVDELLQSNTAVYEGNMWRIIMVPGQSIIDTPDVRLLTANIHKFDKSNRQYLSWSRTQSGAAQAITHNEDTGVYGHMKFPVGVFITQSGKGLDINWLLGEDDVIDPEEDELLAKYQGTASIDGFYLGEWFPVDEFKELVNIIRREI